MNQEIEHVARAFHDAQDDCFSWDEEPEIVKDEFRNYARRAIALFAEHQRMKLLDAGECEEASTIFKAA